MEHARESLESVSARNEYESPPSHSSSTDISLQETQPETISRRPTNVEVSRIETHRLHHQSTVGSKSGRAPKEEWLAFGGDRDYPPDLPDPEIYVVEFAGEHDPMHPHNWPTWKK